MITQVPGREDQLYEQVAQYLNLKRPDVIYRFDLGGLYTPSRYSRSLYSRLNQLGYPDLFIAAVVDGYAGQFLELKRDGVRLKTKAGAWATPHIAAQAAMQEQLRRAGYAADFAVGFDDTIAKIEGYLGGDEMF